MKKIPSMQRINGCHELSAVKIERSWVYQDYWKKGIEN